IGTDRRQMPNWRGILAIKGLISRRSSHGIRDVTFLGAARRRSPQLANKVYSYSGVLPYLYDHVPLYAARTFSRLSASSLDCRPAGISRQRQTPSRTRRQARV